MPGNRILVVGNAGSGKSTLARELGQALDLPVIHLDRLFWLPGWISVPEDEFRRRVAEAMKQEKWVIDGNYLRTMEDRLACADTVVWLDVPTVVSLWGVIVRRLRYAHRPRPDMGEGCPEKIDGEFLRWILTFHKVHRPKYRHLFARFPDVEVIVLHRRKEIRGWIASLRRREHPEE